MGVKDGDEGSQGRRRVSSSADDDEQRKNEIQKLTAIVA